MQFVLHISKKNNNPNKIIVHTAVSSIYSSWKDIDEYHKSTGQHTVSDMGCYCAYHFVIDLYGAIKQCRAIYEMGEHCIGQNDTSIGVCMTGNGDKYLPSDKQKQALARLSDQLCIQLAIDPNNIFPHRKYTDNKTCYGRLIPDSWARDILKEYRLKKYEVLHRHYLKLKRYCLFLLKKYVR